MVRAIMLAAPVIDLPRDNRRKAWMPLLLSAALHLLLGLAWLGFPVPEHQDDGERAMVVDLAPMPPPPAPAKAPEAPKDKPPSPPPLPAPETGAPIPQLEEGMLAQRSSTPKQKERGDEAPVVARPDAKPKPKKPEPVTQNERDFVLGQVLRHWSPPRELSAYDKADVRVTVTVDADGYFADLYDARRRWNPGAVFDGYQSLPPGDVRRRTVDAFLSAIRKAQPVRLPPALKAKAPFSVRLDFRFRDAR